MLESLGEWMGFPALFTAYGGAAPPRSGPYHATIVPYGPFTAGDGGTVFLGVQNEREFAAFCDRVLQKPSLKTDERFSSGPARFRNREAFHREVELFSRPERERDRRAPGGRGYRQCAAERHARFWRHPQLEARGDAGQKSARRAGARHAEAAVQSVGLRAAHGCDPGARRAQPRSSPSWLRARRDRGLAASGAI